jgi:hypothetical protein
VPFFGSYLHKTYTIIDGVYYSSSDRTTAVAQPARVYGGGNIPARALDDTVPPATTDDANPDYQGGTSRGYASGSDYYSNSYNDGLSYYNPSGFNQPYSGPGVSSYNYNPTWSVAPSAYGSPWGYGAGLAVGYGYSPYAMGGFGYPYGGLGYGYPYGGGFYDPFFSPYYSPWGYGSGLSIGFGYGFGGFGGFGYPYGGFGGYPYGYGYGRGYGYYDGYGSRYARPVVYTRGAGVSTPGDGAVLYGSRSNRGGAVMNSRNVNGNPNVVNLGGGRPTGGSYTGNAVGLPGGNAPMPAGNAAPTGRGGRAVSFGEATGQPTYSAPAGQSNNTQPAGSAPGAGRRGFFSGFFGNGSPAGQPTNNAGQPMGNPGYGGRQRNVNYGEAQAGQPQMQQRSYSQPSYQPQRTYSPPQPQMQSSPSRSFGGGSFGGGGGSFGGGGGGGGGRGRR